MKANELIRGDWIYLCNTPCRVKDIIDDGVINYEKDVTPIPLTEEILRNNGFKNDVLAEKSIIAEGTSNFSVILISEDNRIMINNIDEYLNSFNNWHIHIDTEDMRTMCTAEITYVHELQHLLKLCKIEKEIIL